MPKITITFSCLDRLGPMPRAFVAYPNITLCQTTYDPKTAVTSATLPLEVWRKYAKAIAQNEANKRWYVSDVSVEEETVGPCDPIPCDPMKWTDDQLEQIMEYARQRTRLTRNDLIGDFSVMSHRQLVTICKDHRIPGYGKCENTEALQAFVTAYFERQPAAA